MKIFIGILLGLIPLTFLLTSSIIHALFQDEVFISNIRLSVKDFVLPETPTGLHWKNPDVLCGGATNSYTITADWNDSFDQGGSGIKNYQYNILYPKSDGSTGDWTTTVINSQYSGVFNQANGWHKYRVRAFDNAGNASEWSDWCSIYYDNHAPVVSVGTGNDGVDGTRENSAGLPEPIVNSPDNMSPFHGATVSGIIPVYATADDPNMYRYHFRIIKDGETESGKSWSTNGYNQGEYAFTEVIEANLGTNALLDFDPVNPGVQNFDTTKIADGSYWLIIGARDTLNQRNAIDATRDPRINITVDNTAPVISNIAVGSPGQDNTLVTISWDTNEPATSRVRWGITPSFGHNKNDTSYTTHHSMHIGGLSLGQTYYYRVVSKDAMGNKRGITHSFTLSKAGKSPNTTDIVINEFLPNPFGNDNAPKPGGEWVELYNRSSTTIDVAGWKLCDYSSPSCKRPLIIDSSNTEYGTTVIQPNDFLVVYVNGAHANWLNNTKNDVLTLYDDTGVQIDQRSYLGNTVVKGKTIARYPDGGKVWYDPLATPGEDNMLESEGSLQIPDTIPNFSPVDTDDDEPEPTPVPESTEPELSLSRSSDQKSVSFTVRGLKENYKELLYELTYETNTVPQGITGSVELKPEEEEYTKENIPLGTCSTGGICIYHEEVHDIQLTVILKKEDDDAVIELEQTLP